MNICPNDYEPTKTSRCTAAIIDRSLSGQCIVRQCKRPRSTKNHEEKLCAQHLLILKRDKRVPRYHPGKVASPKLSVDALKSTKNKRKGVKHVMEVQASNNVPKNMKLLLMNDIKELTEAVVYHYGKTYKRPSKTARAKMLNYLDHARTDLEIEIDSKGNEEEPSEETYNKMYEDFVDTLKENDEINNVMTKNGIGRVSEEVTYKPGPKLVVADVQYYKDEEVTYKPGPKPVVADIQYYKDDEVKPNLELKYEEQPCKEPEQDKSESAHKQRLDELTGTMATYLQMHNIEYPDKPITFDHEFIKGGPTQSGWDNYQSVHKFAKVKYTDSAGKKHCKQQIAYPFFKLSRFLINNKIKPYFKKQFEKNPSPTTLFNRMLVPDVKRWPEMQKHMAKSEQDSLRYIQFIDYMYQLLEYTRGENWQTLENYRDSIIDKFNLIYRQA